MRKKFTIHDSSNFPLNFQIMDEIDNPRGVYYAHRVRLATISTYGYQTLFMDLLTYEGKMHQLQSKVSP